MDPLLLVFLLESVLTLLGEVESCETILPLQSRVGQSYTLTASCSSYCAGRIVQFTGTGYLPPADLGTYQVCVSGEREFWRDVSEDRNVIETTPWSQCRSIGLVSSDGVVRFSQQITSETSSVCIVLLRSFSVGTRRVPAWESGMGVPLSVWPERQQKLACVDFRHW